MQHALKPPQSFGCNPFHSHVVEQDVMLQESGRCRARTPRLTEGGASGELNRAERNRRPWNLTGIWHFAEGLTPRRARQLPGVKPTLSGRCGTGAVDPKQPSYTLVTWLGIDFGRQPGPTDQDPKIWGPPTESWPLYSGRSSPSAVEELTDPVKQLVK